MVGKAIRVRAGGAHGSPRVQLQKKQQFKAIGFVPENSLLGLHIPHR